MGPALARPGPLRRLERLQHRRPALDLEVPRLGHRRPEPRHAVRRVRRSTRSPATSGPARPSAQKVATGFHRNTPINQEGGIDVEQFRIESVVDRVNTTGTVFLGLTVGCCQCHDHKYDPISQREYYQFFAFFNNVDEPDLALASPEDARPTRQAAAKAVDAYLTRARGRATPTSRAAEARWEATLDMVGRQKQSQEVREAFDVAFEKRTEAQQPRPCSTLFVDQDPGREGPTARRSPRSRRERRSSSRRWSSASGRSPARRIVHLGGDFTRTGEPRRAGRPGRPARRWTDVRARRPDRLDLARWLVDPPQPADGPGGGQPDLAGLLRPRPGRDRERLRHPGHARRRTPSCSTGWPPSSSDRGWSLKAIHRLIVTSATYRQSSRVRPELAGGRPGQPAARRGSRGSGSTPS